MKDFTVLTGRKYPIWIPKISRAILKWLPDSSIRKFFKNVGYLFTGNIFASILGLVTAALTARALGPGLFGVLALIQAYARLVDQIFNFQFRQTLIRYGTEELVHKRRKNFEDLVAVGTVVEVGTALLAAVVAALAISWAGPLIGLNDQYIELAILYTLVIFLNPIGTPTASLQLLDRFNIIARVNIIGSSVRLLAVGLAVATKITFPGFVLVYLATEIFRQLLLLAAGWRALRQQGYQFALTSSDGSIRQNLPRIVRKSRSYEGLWSFVISTNLSASAKLIVQQGDIILLGALLGPAAAGLYKIVTLLALGIKQISDPVFHAIYPEISMLIVKRKLDVLRALIIKTRISLSLYVAIVWILLAVFGRPLIGLILGDQYLDAWKPSLIYIAGITALLLSIHTVPILWALGKAQKVLVIEVASSVVYIPILYLSISQYGIMGAAYGLSIWAVGYSLVRTLIANNELRDFEGVTSHIRHRNLPPVARKKDRA